MLCMYCERKFKGSDEVISVNEYGLCHEGECAEEFVYEHITGNSFEFSSMSEWDLQFYDDEGRYDRSFLKKPFDVFIEDEYFTTVYAIDPDFALSEVPFPYKKYRNKMARGEEINVSIREVKDNDFNFLIADRRTIDKGE